MKTLILSVLLFSHSSMAANAIKIVINHPDKEEKTYIFVPTEKEASMKLKLNSKTECYVGAHFLDLEKKALYAISVECYPKANEPLLGIESLFKCGNSGIAKVQEPKKGKDKGVDLTAITVTCE